MKVEVKDKQIVVGKTKVPLLSGEVHYWRLEPKRWEIILDRVKEMGLDVIATYVPWNVHEYKEGMFDFKGKTSDRNDLVSFLQLARKKKLWVIFRPGPKINAEMHNEGYPSYIAKYHSLHPQFLKAAERYMKAVCKTAVPYQATEKGNIILWQVDNEIYPQVEFYRKQMGLGKNRGLFQEFLKEKYKDDIGLLNKTWRSTFSSFDKVSAFLTGSDFALKVMRHPAFRCRYLDSLEFYYWYTKKYFLWVKEKYEENGVTVPIYTNSPGGFALWKWSDLQSVSEIHGVDLYHTNEFSRKVGIGGTIDSFENLMTKASYCHTYARIPYIAEFQSGTITDFASRVSDNHYKILAYSALAGGIVGWNWYMLVERETCIETPIYGDGCRKVTTFDTFKEIVNVFKKINPPELTKLTETSVTFDHTYMAKRDDREGPSAPLQAVYDSGMDFVRYDMELNKINKPILFYVGDEYLKRGSQAVLLKYMEAGGNLVIFHNYPMLDENFDDCNLLDILFPSRIFDVPCFDFNHLEIKLKNEKIVVSPPIFEYESVKGTPIKGKIVMNTRLINDKNKDRDSLGIGEELTCGYIEKRGKGRLIVLGVAPTPELVVQLHNSLGVPIYCRSCTKGIYGSLFKRKNKFYVVAVNHSDEDKCAKIILNKTLFRPGKYKIVNLPDGESSSIDLRNSNVIYPQISRKNGAVIELSPQ